MLKCCETIVCAKCKGILELHRAAAIPGGRTLPAFTVCRKCGDWNEITTSEYNREVPPSEHVIHIPE